MHRLITSLQITAIIILFPLEMVCQTTRDAAVRLSPEYSTGGPVATKAFWTPGDYPQNALVQKKSDAARTWETQDTLPAPRDAWEIDLQQFVEEVSVNQRWTIRGLDFYATGYIRSRIDLPPSMIASPRRVLVLVDAEASVELSDELDRLSDDLIREGWVVEVKGASSTSSARQLKQIILSSVKETSRGPLTHVMIVGDLPYAMSGGFTTLGSTPPADYHHEHGGAWAADAYYADVETSDGVDAEYQWTDYLVNISSKDEAERDENKNTPGDGKFDQSMIPTDLELCVGRIDMRRLKSFGVKENNRAKEFELLRKYFDKDHAYRTRSFIPPMRGLIEDNFGLMSHLDRGWVITEAFAASGYRSFSPIVGAENVFEGDWINSSELRKGPSLDSMPSLLAYGCGGGGYDVCNQLGETKDFASNPLYAVFTMLFGSYFGDVWSEDNLMRAALAADGWVLTCGWSGRPHWVMHPLADGTTIGECQRMTANNAGEYIGATIMDQSTGQFYPLDLGNRYVNNLLLGDPTLTLQGPIVSDNASATEMADGKTTLHWSTSEQHNTDTKGMLVAYLIETSPSLATPFHYVSNVLSSNQSDVTYSAKLPADARYVRIRPYFTSEGRLGPVIGRGTIIERTISSVSEDRNSHPDSENLPSFFRVFNTLGVEVATFRGNELSSSDLRNTALPTGVYLVVDVAGKSRLVNFSR